MKRQQTIGQRMGEGVFCSHKTQEHDSGISHFT